jgi:hypothetical protein
MRLEIPEILWHGDKDRIMSIDFYPFKESLKTFNKKLIFVTGGTCEDPEDVGFVKVFFYLF